VLVELERLQSPSVVGRRLGLSDRTVRRLRGRYLDEGMPALKDRPRSGRPPTIDPVSRCELISMACGLPSDFGVTTRSLWSYGALAEAFAARGGMKVSRSSVVRILRHVAIRPHKVKMWCHSPDPQFREKATRLCELYLHPPPGAVVLCVDEKTGMQALGRRFPVRAAGKGREVRIDSHYKRNGTRKLIAAFEVATGRVYGEMRPTRKAADLVEFMEAVAKRYPGKQVYIIWDNLNIHYDGKDSRWTKFNDRHSGRFHFFYTPVHASWLNQVEIWFGTLQRRILRHGVFDSLEEIDSAVLSFIDDYNAGEAHPYKWTFTGYPLQAEAIAA